MNSSKKTSQKRRITVAVSNDLLTDQRVLRSCDALYEAGFAISLVGRTWPDSRKLQKPYKSSKMQLLFKRTALFYAEFNARLFLKLLFSQADAFYANDTDTLLAVALAARLRRKPFVFDAHELFPDVPELIGKPFVQKVWRWVERRFIPQASLCVTVNQSLAEEYERRYGVGFIVVRNLSSHTSPRNSTFKIQFCDQGERKESSLAFPNRSRMTPPAAKFKIILYQGAVNKGRCVKELIDAMEFLPDCRLVVAGAGDLLVDMRHYAAAKPYSWRIDFVGRLLPDKLRSITSKASLGFCVMRNMGLNYYFSLPNRIGDFASAGIPVVASDFPEIKKVVGTYRIGALVSESTVESAEALAAVIEKTLNEWASLSDVEKSARFAAAREDLSWKNEQKKLIHCIDTIFVNNNS